MLNAMIKIKLTEEPWSSQSLIFSKQNYLSILSKKIWIVIYSFRRQTFLINVFIYIIFFILSNQKRILNHANKIKKVKKYMRKYLEDIQKP